MSNPFEEVGSRNPFDDSVAHGASTSRINTNPFNASTGSFDDDGMGATATDTVGEEDYTVSDADELAPTDAPVEASWQYLGDLPYRRVPIYNNVRWGASNHATKDGDGAATNGASGTNAMGDVLNYGLSAFPKAALQRHPDLMNPRELRDLLNSSTVTKVVGCQYGGPIAAVTLPIIGETSWFNRTEIRILTNSGRLVKSIDFPLPGMERKYTPSDIMEIGFTDRTALVIILKDSLCLTYDLTGEPLLPPFHILPRTEGHGTELVQVNVFEGGAAVISSSKHTALVEYLDEHDDPTYFSSAHLGARRIVPADYVAPDFGGGVYDTMPPFCALVTHLPTAAFASENFLSFSAIAVLPRTKTASRHPEVFLSTNDNSVLVINAATAEMKDLDCRARISSPIVEMTFAPNGRFLACFSESSMLTVIDSTFQTKVLDFDTSEGSTQPPLEIRWCGEDSVVLHWKNLGILMVGPYGDWLRFPCENFGNIYLIPEIDCCRVVSDVSVEILQRVPPATALLLRIGSIEPAAMLLDASDAFDSGSASSDDAARAITKTGMLSEAIEGCTDAAAKEFDIATQKRLLRAASYGMHFTFKDPKERRNIMGGNYYGAADENASTMPSRVAVNFVNTARKLRILNSIRNPDVGFVLTSAQYDAITPFGVLARLIAINRPALATSISKYLRLPKSVQLYARASKAAAFVAAAKNLSDADTAEGAIRIITEDEGGSASTKTTSSSINRGGFAKIAMDSMKVGRPGVANLLLMLETSVADKVPALLSIGSYADAVAVATTAHDTDFIFYTTMEYQKYCMKQYPDPVKVNQAFMNAVVTKFTPESYHTIRRYMGTMPDPKNEISLQVRGLKFIDAGMTIAKRALEGKTESRGKQAMLTEASKIFAMGKETGFHKSATDDYVELLKDQEILRTKYSSSEVAPDSSSVIDTIYAIIQFAGTNEREQHRLLNDADKVAKKFRVPEKMLWHTKVKAFSATGQWSNLKSLADSRTKPPIGYKPFARAAIRGKQSPNDVLRYIEKITSPEERFSLYGEALMWKRALEEAFKMKDERRIVDVKARCNNPEIQLSADQMLGRLA
ncbi:Vps16 vacuolar sorting complex protein [Nitzschia inconspicua]|uniref:Vps16 vacuolar sorting complex protein n=1 Tax=Nitzschia inconspicua TaxID=303405 RepID=A0A9K3KNA3_9STRA|nr:Vps16 vacuolar sorting complex protein [Nitzschia inconspicua]